MHACAVEKCGLFTKLTSSKMLTLDAFSRAKSVTEYVWRLGSALTRWGTLSATPDLLAAMGRGSASKGKRGKRRGAQRKGGKGKGCAVLKIP